MRRTAGDEGEEKGPETESDKGVAEEVAGGKCKRQKMKGQESRERGGEGGKGGERGDWRSGHHGR